MVYHVVVKCTKYDKERNVLKQVVSDEWREEISEWTGMNVERTSQLMGIVRVVNMKVVTKEKEFLKIFTFSDSYLSNFLFMILLW